MVRRKSNSLERSVVRAATSRYIECSRSIHAMLASLIIKACSYASLEKDNGSSPRILGVPEYQETTESCELPLYFS